MKRILLLILITILFTSCRNEISGPAGDKGRVKGYIFNKSSNERIADATVILNSSMQPIKSSEDGKFELDDLDTGEYEITVSRIGFESFTSEINVNGYITTELEIPLTKIKEEESPDGLLANWKLDNNALDYGPFGFNGDAKGVLYVVDRKGNDNRAALFNPFLLGPESKILVSNSLQLTDEFTISLWVFVPTEKGETDDNYIDLVSKWSNKGNTKSSFSFCIAESSNLNSIALKTESISGQKKVTSTNNTVPYDKWTHIAVTFNNGTATFYVNGNIGMTRSGVPIPQTTDLNMSIGGRQDQASSFRGIMDDIYVFNKALSSSEISKLYSE